MTLLRFATRASALALVQTDLARDALRGVTPNLEVEYVEVSTEGDHDRVSPLTEIGGRGVFVRAVEQALLDGRADVAVHSLKDMPTAQLPGLVLAATLERGDVRDALVSREGGTLAGLAAGARVGSSSRRRAAQVLSVRADLEVVEIRGNVDTRLRKVAEGEYDAAVLAAAGLERLGRLGEATELFDPASFPPAPGQGAIVLQCRAGDASTLALLDAVNHLETHRATDAERGFLAALGAGCTLPLGAYAYLEGGRLRLRGMLVGEDGVPRFDDIEGDPADAEATGRALGERMAAVVGLAT